MTDVASHPPAAFATRWPAARRFVFVGVACIVAGGVVAAVTRPTDFELGPWVAAYLVLVGGVAQVALGGGQAWLAPHTPRPQVVGLELLGWNLGAAATIVGTLASAPVVTTLGGLATAAALIGFFREVRGGGASARGAWLCYRIVVAIVAVSIPVGLVLAWIRHG